MRSPVLVLSLLAGGAVLASWGHTGDTTPDRRPAATESAYRAVPNLLSNPSFEMDWMHNAVTVQTRFHLLEQSDWGYGQADGLPDCWIVTPTAYRDAAVSRFGNASLRLQGTASQVVYLCGETDPRDGGAHYNAFRPLPAALVEDDRASAPALRCVVQDPGRDGPAGPFRHRRIQPGRADNDADLHGLVRQGHARLGVPRGHRRRSRPTSACPTPLSCG